MAKKYRLSSFGGSELQSAYIALVKLKQTLILEESEDQTDSDEPAFDEQIDDMILLMESKLEGLRSLSSLGSGMALEDLEKLNITWTGFLTLKSDYEERLEPVYDLGNDALWSSANFRRQLKLLESLVPRTNEGCARAWIDAFFLRTSAMLPPTQRMVVNMEQRVPKTSVGPSSISTLSGFADYTAIVANQDTAEMLWKSPTLNVVKKFAPSGFFVIEAKLLQPAKQIAQAVCDLYACGRFFEKQILRGALTNGLEWIFVIIRIDDDHAGASFSFSETLSKSSKINHREIGEAWPDVIAGILLHWTKNGFTDIELDDWFKESK